jgi:hypothetical protein
MKFSIDGAVLHTALTKIKNVLGNTTYLKIKAGKSLLLASDCDGFSILIKTKEFKLEKEGTVCVDFNTFFQSLKSTGKLEFYSKDSQIEFSVGKYKAAIQLIEDEINFEHKGASNHIELDENSTIIFEYLDSLIIKDIKFKGDDSPVSIDLSAKSKTLELSSASYSEAVLIEASVKTKSSFTACLSPNILRRIKSLVGKNSYQISMSDSTVSVHYADKVLDIEFNSPLQEFNPTSTESIKYSKADQISNCKNRITIQSKDLSEYFSKIKNIYEQNNPVEVVLSEKYMELSYATSKGKIKDSIPKAFDKIKSDDSKFLVDYDLWVNNLSKLSDKITLYFCDKALCMEVESSKTKFFIMVQLL